jgi:GNAT superfamily N-acetyltransferase
MFDHQEQSLPGVVGMATDITRSWVAGWVLSRGVPDPTPEPWGLSIAVGAPTQAVRHVLLDADDATVRALAEAVTVPTTWIKGFVETAAVAPLLTPDWTPDQPTCLMAAELRSTNVIPTGGYTVESRTTAGVTHVRVLTTDGCAAARGQVAVTGETCVFDQISTEPEHQRRGLGSVVMGALTGAAIDQGAGTGILGATVQGRALYEALGWHIAGPMTGFVYKPAA